jgi:hypothetical protein
MLQRTAADRRNCNRRAPSLSSLGSYVHAFERATFDRAFSKICLIQGQVPV